MLVGSAKFHGGPPVTCLIPPSPHSTNSKVPNRINAFPFSYPGVVSGPMLVVINDGDREFGSVQKLTLQEGDKGESVRMAGPVCLERNVLDLTIGSYWWVLPCSGIRRRSAGVHRWIEGR